MSRQSTVFVVDDDPGSLRSLGWHLSRAGLPVRSFASGDAFLKGYSPKTPSCLILDLRMPRTDGLAVMRRLSESGDPVPVIMVTGAADIPSCISAFRLGVFDFLEKPVDQAEFLDCVRRALAKSTHVDGLICSQPASETLSRLTAAERTVLDHLVAGKTLKQIAQLRDVSVQSVWRHRLRILSKFAVENEVELVRVLLKRSDDAPRTS